jgi:hypothetical protein
MKRILLILSALLILFVSPVYATNFFGYTILTGGGTGALDKINPSNGDMAIGMISGYFYGYKYDAFLGTTPDGVNIITPVGNAGGLGRWILQKTTPIYAWRGAWVSGNNYALWDITTDATGAYVCISAISNSLVTPATDTTHFTLMVANGATGAQGSQGQAGTNGSNGTNGQGFLWRNNGCQWSL